MCKALTREEIHVLARHRMFKLVLQGFCIV